MDSVSTAYIIGVLGIIVLVMGFVMACEDAGAGLLIGFISFIILGYSIYLYVHINNVNNELKDIAYQYQQVMRNDDISNKDLDKIKQDIKFKYDYEVQIIDNNCLSNIYKEKETDVKTKNEKESIKQIDTLNNKGNDKFIKISLNKKDTSYTLIIYETSYKEDNSKRR